MTVFVVVETSWNTNRLKLIQLPQNRDHLFLFFFFQRHATLTPSSDDFSLAPPELPEKRKSYASTTSSRASSVFSDTAPDPTCPMSPLSPSGHFSDRMGNMLTNPYPLDSRHSSGSSTSTLSATAPRPRVGDFELTGTNTNGSNGYSYVTPPTSPRVPYDCVSSPHEAVASWVSENTSYFSTSSSFHGDVLSPRAPSLPNRGLNKGAQLPSSTPRNIDLITEMSPTKEDSTPPLRPFKGRQTFSSLIESWSVSETSSSVTSSTTMSESRVMSRDEPAPKPRTPYPVPIPRRGTMGASSRPGGSLSRSVSDASDDRGKAPPPVLPRKSMYVTTEQSSKTPPPKPPRPSQSPITKPPPPLPKPYASKSASNSPTGQRKAVNSERKET